MAKEKALLQMIDVVRDFKQGGEVVHALKKTNLSIMAGQLVAIIGPSGSGKSTFLTIAGGLQLPTSGVVLIEKTDITNMNSKQLSDIRLNRIGFILQSSNLVPFLSVDQQLELRSRAVGQSVNKVSRDKIFQELGIESLRSKYPSELSGGERQRVAIAKAIYGDPNIILADEPTASLDTKKAFEVVEIIARQAKDHKKAVIMVTHDERLIKYCDVVYVMKDGILSLKK